MMKKLFILCIIFLLLTACSEEKKEVPIPKAQGNISTMLPSAEDAPSFRNSYKIEDMQIGLNFIRYYFSTTDTTPKQRTSIDISVPYTQPEAIFADFDLLNIQAYRQFVKADLLWATVEPQEGKWDFDAADSVIMYSDKEPIVTLFSLQYASPNPPWAKKGDEFQKTLGPEAIEYVTRIVQRYGPYVKYWEIGNEMDHWRIMDNDGVNGKGVGAELGMIPVNAVSFTPQEQGKFLAQVADIIKENDPDAVIILPGISSLDEYCTTTWLEGVIEGAGGSDWFDVINYHYYPSWERYTLLREAFGDELKQIGIENKPVWLTETGVTSSASLTLRTNYPNSPDTQAADIFRRIIQAYGMGDSFVMWHTYISSGDTGDWASYGIINNAGVKQKSYYSFKLLTDELIPFNSVVQVSGGDVKQDNIYEIHTQTGKTKYVAWGTGVFEVPEGMTQMTSVVPDDEGTFNGESVSQGQKITLDKYPILLK